MNNLKSLREYFLLSQRELGEKIGLGQSNYFRMEQGTLNPSVRLGRLLNYFCEQMFFCEEFDITQKISDFRKKFKIKKKPSKFKERMLMGFHDLNYSSIDENIEELFPNKDAYFGMPFVGSYCYENPEDKLIQKEAVELFSYKLEKLSPRKREIFDLYLDENNFSEIARKLNITREGVRQSVNLTLDQLGKNLRRSRNLFGRI